MRVKITQNSSFVTNPSRDGLKDLQSSFVKQNPDLVRPNIKLWTVPILDFVLIVILAVFVFVFLNYIILNSSYPGAPSGSVPFKALALGNGVATIIFGIIFILIGFKEFSNQQSFDSVPLNKIDAAAVGLNKFECNILPESGNTIISPVSGKQCVFYNIQLYKTSFNEKVSAAMAPYQKLPKIMITYNIQSMPTLFSDGTGYLAPDFESSNIVFTASQTNNVVANSSTGYDKLPHIESDKIIIDFKSEDEFTPITNFINKPDPNKTLMQIINETIQTYSVKSGQKPSPEKLDVSSKTDGNSKPMLKAIIYAYELPVDQKYTLMGEIRNTGQTFNGKPLKVLKVDGTTTILTITPSKAKALFKRDLRFTVLSMSIGSIMVIISAILLL